MTTSSARLAALLLVAAAFTLAACDARKEGPKPAPAGPGSTPVAAAPHAAGDSAEGAALFTANCAVCHGPDGKGDGTAAYLLWPRPRDFTKGKFKIRTTESGSMPTDDDLFAVITNGMPGTAMPAWRFLSDTQRRSLVLRVKEMSQFLDADSGTVFNFFKERGPGNVVPVPPETADDAASRDIGKKAYEKMSCAKCHGPTGHADGPSAADLKDDFDQPIRANDFSQGIFKGGSANRDVFLRFATGLSGTPMPSFNTGELTDEEKWGLVHYVKSLSGDAPKALAAALPYGSELAAVKVAALPKDQGDPAWDAVPAVDIPLSLLFARASAPRLLRVRAAHDGAAVAFQLSWADSSDSHAPLRPEDFRDGAAVMFALKGMDTPPMMGSKDRPVEVWHWKADWQVDLGRWQDVEQIHPGMAVEMYPFEKDETTIVNKGSRPSPLPGQDRAFQSAWAAGNPMTNPARKSPCEICVAAGFGTLTSVPEKEQVIAGQGEWKDGRWTIFQRRALAAPDDGCVSFKPGVEVPVAFAVWDGASGDRAGQKSVAFWYRLVLR